MLGDDALKAVFARHAKELVTISLNLLRKADGPFPPSNERLQ